MRIDAGTEILGIDQHIITVDVRVPAIDRSCLSIMTYHRYIGIAIYRGDFELLNL